MHVFFRWQHLDLNVTAVCADPSCATGSGTKTAAFGQKFSPSYDSLDIFQVGGVIFF